MSTQQLKLLPTLYKQTKTEADQEWTIGTRGNAIVTRWGQIGGSIQETTDVIKTGKNIGRSNETSANEQAELEAQSKWEKKLKKGYVQNLADAQDKKTDSIIEGGIFPMLAHVFEKREKELVYPCYTQPKLDGHRCIGSLDVDSEATLWSRTRKLVTSMTHINEALERLEMHSVVFDGEFYNHEYKDRFEDLTSYIRRSEPTPETDEEPGSIAVQYHVYDLPSAWPFKDRWAFLVDHFNKHGDSEGPLRLVETNVARDKKELMAHLDMYLEQGYEGAMARNANGMYINDRSTDLLKVKVFLDDEFPIVGVVEGRGNLQGHGVFACRTKEGKDFGVVLGGPRPNLKQYLKNPELAIGRLLTVKYQGLSKYGIPRFPVGLRFYEEV